MNGLVSIVTRMLNASLEFFLKYKSISISINGFKDMVLFDRYKPVICELLWYKRSKTVLGVLLTTNTTVWYYLHKSRLCER